MTINVPIDDRFCVNTQEYNSSLIYASGDIPNACKIERYLSENKIVNHELINLLLTNKDNFSIIIDNEDYVFAAVDRIKSYPLYYSGSNAVPLVSNSSQKIRSQLIKANINHHAELMLAMSGYVFGNDTLYDEIKQLQAGEILFWRKNTPLPEITQYYSYLAAANSTLSLDALTEQFSDILDSVISQLIKKAAGRVICLPLSGGLDSRLLLAKLVEHQYQNILTFSYGPNGNHEMRQAERIAKQLGVPWHKVASNTKRARTLYNSSLRKSYSEYAHGFTNIPSYMEFEAISTLKNKQIIPNDALIVNGQSGDFISGGHVPEFLFRQSVSLDIMTKYCIDKHCSYWLHLKSESNLKIIENIINQQLQKISNDSTMQLSPAAIYECWEWQERQSKLVIRGQRLYDFFGFDWSLPFWHDEMMAFWSTVPYKFKRNQNLYINYLRKYNYKNVFSTLRAKVQPWTLRYAWIPYAAKLIRLTFGKKQKEKFYKKMHYYSTYHDQYALFGHDYYLQYYKQIRDPASLMIRHYLDEMGFDIFYKDELTCVE